uniref:Uncharacterized protein n=1 Tax=Phaseolus vulgaris TaxID=3885 RepID=V7BJD1_PHAVU|nr:hypothetical protein PHAVU_006G011900g [Phaseolus vulgaris]ESW18087.1 hypothetical protein PHAVU_006G011900g [Phaseolus vulgaris]
MEHVSLRSSDGIQCISAGRKTINTKRSATRGLPRRPGRKTINTKRSATRGLPRRSPILVLLSPKHAYLRSSDGIRCISAGRKTINTKRSATRGLPRRSPILVLLSPEHA